MIMNAPNVWIFEVPSRYLQTEKKNGSLEDKIMEITGQIWLQKMVKRLITVVP